MPCGSVSLKPNILIFHMVQEPLFVLGRGIGTNWENLGGAAFGKFRRKLHAYFACQHCLAQIPQCVLGIGIHKMFCMHAFNRI